MKIHDCLQGSAEWLACRVGKVTASEAGNLLTPKFEIRTGETPKTYMFAKLAEAFRGSPLPGYSSHAMENGQILEDEARRAFCFQHDGPRIHNVGFCEHDDGRAGCSPDALIGDESGLELKAPMPHTHVRYLVEGKLPDAYAVQVHFSMYVTGRPEWAFMSFARKFPEFILTVKRDEQICAVIAEALEGFYHKFDEAMERLRSI